MNHEWLLPIVLHGRNVGFVPLVSRFATRFQVMAAFLEEAHGRHLVQRQIDLAEQLGLGKALFQEFRKEIRTGMGRVKMGDGRMVRWGKAGSWDGGMVRWCKMGKMGKMGKKIKRSQLVVMMLFSCGCCWLVLFLCYDCFLQLSVSIVNSCYC